MKIDSSVSAVVTGGASGLGAATARRLAGLGVKVALFDLNEVNGEPLAQELNGVFCKVDITDDGQVDAAFQKARTSHGQERVLVNCAGIGGAAKTASRAKDSGKPRHHPLDLFERIVQVNLIGTFRCSATAAMGMLSLAPRADGERGVIISTASVAARDGQIGQVAYAASKAGIVGMTLPMARDLMDQGIRVNAIMPGLFDTPLMGSLPDQIKTALAGSVPFPKRLGTPAEYAGLVVAIIGNDYLNGESIRLDGALRMAPR